MQLITLGLTPTLKLRKVLSFAFKSYLLYTEVVKLMPQSYGECATKGV